MARRSTTNSFKALATVSATSAYSFDTFDNKIKRWPLLGILPRRVFNWNGLAHHQVVLYVFKCTDYCVAGDLRSKVLPANEFEPEIECLITTTVREVIFNPLNSLCGPVP